MSRRGVRKGGEGGCWWGGGGQERAKREDGGGKGRAGTIFLMICGLKIELRCFA